VLLNEFWAHFHDGDRDIQESIPTDYDPQWFTLNGRCYPQTILPNDAASLPPALRIATPNQNYDDAPDFSQPNSALVQCNAGERVLLRLANLGYRQHAMQLPGIPMRVVGQDASLLRNGTVDTSYWPTPSTSDRARHGTCCSTRPRTTPPRRAERTAAAPTTSTSSRTGLAAAHQLRGAAGTGRDDDRGPGLREFRCRLRPWWVRPMSKAVRIGSWPSSWRDGAGPRVRCGAPGGRPEDRHGLHPRHARRDDADLQPGREHRRHPDPDGNAVLMWSYANGDAPDSGRFQSPGPVLCANQGETIVVNLANLLPEATSVVFPGQDAAVTTTGGAAGLFTREAPPGGAVSYRFTAGSPGTYLYESGSDSAKQVEMGLYGALVVRPAGCPTCAYDAGTGFDPAREFLLLLAEIDPDLHHAVETGGTYDVTALHNRYFTINGRSFPDTIQDNGSALLPDQPYGALVRIQPNTPTSAPALLRMLNAGVDNHPFHPHGNHTREIAQDGRLLAPSEHFGETVGSGQTIDYLLRWDSQATDSSGAAFNDD